MTEPIYVYRKGEWVLETQEPRSLWYDLGALCRNCGQRAGIHAGNEPYSCPNRRGGWLSSVWA